MFYIVDINRDAPANESGECRSEELRAATLMTNKTNPKGRISPLVVHVSSASKQQTQMDSEVPHHCNLTILALSRKTGAQLVRLYRRVDVKIS